MKVAILALVAAVSLVQSTEAFCGWGGLYGGYGLWGKRSTDETEMPLRNPINRTECMFNKLTNVIACSGSKELVTCQTEIIGKDYHDDIQFAIGISTNEQSIVNWTTDMEGDLLPICIQKFGSLWLEN